MIWRDNWTVLSLLPFATSRLSPTLPGSDSQQSDFETGQPVPPQCHLETTASEDDGPRTPGEVVLPRASAGPHLPLPSRPLPARSGEDFALRGPTPPRREGP